jgi:ABC-type cobalamin/Fe3+-siderophores transport system ATPase subunit
MRITRIAVENFRSLDGFAIDLEAESRFIVGENAIGKSSLITAIARALGRDRIFSRSDFLDLAKPIEIRVTLIGLDSAQLGVFADAADFGAVTSVTMGVTAIWDSDAEEIEVVHGYPTKSWHPSKRSERDAVEVYWIPDSRDAARLLQFGMRKGLIADALAKLDLEKPISAAIDEIEKACAKLGATPDLQVLMQSAGSHLKSFIPVGAKPYGIGGTASTEVDVLRQLQLVLDYAGTTLPISEQSSGLIQLTLFAFSLLAIAQRPGSILLVDEPELSLHPQSQKALLRSIQSLQSQYLLASHAATLLDRADVRHLIRLYRDATKVKAARPSKLTAPEAARLARFTTAENAEAFFARAAILVEGQSDKYALEAVAAKKKRNLDADGVTIVAMRGAGGIGTFLSLLGPDGLKLKLAGLCDAGDETKWAKALGQHGMGAKLDRAAMSAIGFEVCDADLEEVLIAAAGEKTCLAIIDAQGDKTDFQTFAQQPTQKSKSTVQQLHDFLHSRNITYAPLLVDAIDPTKLPGALERVIDEV